MRKHTALKALQGMIWLEGYRSRDFTAHMYPDVAPQLQAWHAAGHKLAVYSSGSVAAQKLLFGNSDAGDLLPLFDAFFDTEVGHKRDADSYLMMLVAALFPLVGLGLLATAVANDAGPWRTSGGVIFGASALLLFSTSVLYHASTSPRLKPKA
mgnify:CR=1 FL=1